jgi:mitochondrial fission protein ELM1
MRICYVSDGKAGHVAQAHGLFFALKRQYDQAELIELPVQSFSITTLIIYWLSGGRLGQLPDVLKPTQSIDLFIVVGHRTHWTGVLFKKIFKNSRLLVLMTPSLPLSWFDYAIVPLHDNPLIQNNIFIAQGALNPVINEKRHQPNRVLMLIGGPSKRHGWSMDQLIAQVERVVNAHPDHQLILTTSRRTPDDFLAQGLFQHLPKTLSIFPVSQTPQGWLFEQLQLASEVWVTEDSVSMIYEALTAGCRVRLLKMPRLKEDRITRSVDQLLENGLVSYASSLNDDQQATCASISLNEADRAAIWLLQHLQGIKSQ